MSALQKGDRVKLSSSALIDADCVMGEIALVSENQKSIAIHLESTCGVRAEGGFLVMGFLPLMRESEDAQVEDLWGNPWRIEPA